MIKVKTKILFGDLLMVSYHPLLIIMIYEIDSRFKEVMVTSGYRKNDEGVHGTVNPCRGLDIRSWIYDDPQSIVDFINDRFTYDPKRPKYKCALYHDVGKGKHIHLQTHKDTVYEKNA